MGEAIETRTGVVRLRDDGAIEVRIHPKVRQLVADAKENLQAASALAGLVRRPLLVDIQQSEALDPQARHYYATSPLHGNFTRFALLINASPLGRMMGNVYLKMSKHRVPTRLFASEDEAIGWLCASPKT